MKSAKHGASLREDAPQSCWGLTLYRGRSCCARFRRRQPRPCSIVMITNNLSPQHSPPVPLLLIRSSPSTLSIVSLSSALCSPRMPRLDITLPARFQSLKPHSLISARKVDSAPHLQGLDPCLPRHEKPHRRKVRPLPGSTARFRLHLHTKHTSNRSPHLQGRRRYKGVS